MSYDVDLIDRIYEAAVVPDRWPDVLARVAKVGSAFGGVLYAVTPQSVGSNSVSLSPVPRWIACETASPFVERFINDGWLQNNKRAERAVYRNQYGFLGDNDLFSAGEIAEEPMYKYMRGLGIGWHSGLTVQAPSGDVLIFNFERRHDAGPSSMEDLVRLDELKSHLARSALLSARLGLDKAKTGAEALSIVGLPAAFLSTRFRSLASNKGFDQLGIFIEGSHGSISLKDSKANKLLHDAFARMGVGNYDQVCSIPVPANSVTSAVVVHVVAMRRSARDVFAPATCVLIATPVDKVSSPDTHIIRGLFDLTNTEALVAVEISNGRTIEQIAATAGKAVGTVRQQLKSIFAKTGATRQVELVRLLANTVSIAPL